MTYLLLAASAMSRQEPDRWRDEWTRRRVQYHGPLSSMNESKAAVIVSANYLSCRERKSEFDWLIDCAFIRIRESRRAIRTNGLLAVSIHAFVCIYCGDNPCLANLIHCLISYSFPSAMVNQIKNCEIIPGHTSSLKQTRNCILCPRRSGTKYPSW